MLQHEREPSEEADDDREVVSADPDLPEARPHGERVEDDDCRVDGPVVGDAGKRVAVAVRCGQVIERRIQSIEELP